MQVLDILRNVSRSRESSSELEHSPLLVELDLELDESDEGDRSRRFRLCFRDRKEKLRLELPEELSIGTISSDVGLDGLSNSEPAWIPVFK